MPETDSAVDEQDRTVPASAADDAAPLSIGEVLSVLREEFPDVTISKIRFLESQGLVQPERNASGYRQFGDVDIERLRWILRQQRDHFLPLKVIRRALERGVDVIDAGAGDQPTLWTAVAEAAAQEEIGQERERITRSEAADARRSAARSRTHPSTRGEQAAGAAGAVRETPTGARRRHSSPADVVAALQEDPRPPVPMGPAAPRARPASSEQGADAERPDAEGPDAEGPDAEAIEAASPAAPSGSPSVDVNSPGGQMRQLGREELLAESGLSEVLLDELAEYGLVAPVEVAGELVYDEVDLAVAELATRSAELGLSPRHLRMYKVAAVREAGLLEQVAMPLLKQRNPAAKAKAADTVADLRSLGSELHGHLLARELGPHLAPRGDART